MYTPEQKREYERNWYQTIGKQKKKDANIRWAKKKRAEFTEIKSKLKCNRCGENHSACLEFHHKDPSTKEALVSDMAAKSSTKRILKEIEKCEVLCANCHRKEHNPI